MHTNIVIGANFGDEGKGLVTDFYAAQNGEKSLVIRHNSGAQAGHTVTLNDGRRHVFNHIGAGSFAGASTYLSSFFACNPMLFAKEYRKLDILCDIPPVYIDRRSLVTTPYDIIINQLAEDTRGAKRHGSCGVGFGETIERNLYAPFALTVSDLENLPAFLKKLLAIRHEWLPKRLVELGVGKVPPIWAERVESEQLLEDFVTATGFMLRTMHLVDSLPARGFNHLVFEGAQGLLLDQGHEYFPHVTRSFTGIRNAFAILEEGGFYEAKVTYVTRSYLTRHGAGPLPYELAKQPYEGITDQTNVRNDYQGDLRFAWLDVDALSAAVQKDVNLIPPNFQVETGLAVTWMDQVGEQAAYYTGGVFTKRSSREFLEDLYRVTSASFGLASYGPTRECVRREIS